MKSQQTNSFIFQLCDIFKAYILTTHIYMHTYKCASCVWSTDTPGHCMHRYVCLVESVQSSANKYSVQVQITAVRRLTTSQKSQQDINQNTQLSKYLCLKFGHTKYWHLKELKSLKWNWWVYNLFFLFFFIYVFNF